MTSIFACDCTFAGVSTRPLLDSVFDLSCVFVFVCVVREPGLHEELEKPLDELSAQSTSGTQERSSLPSWWSSVAGLEARRESG